MPTPITANTGTFISVSEARTMSTSWINAQLSTPSTANPKAFGFGKDKIQDILDQSGCVGIRIYNGIDENGNKNVIVIATDSNGDDMTSGLVLDLSAPCPNMCAPNNALN
ncbi:MAG TPA: hypothetical protein VK590_11575 [Saprospiraceae bacterium]|nr:hypothetical protein [Saprospiraceae bacterium]